MIAQNEVNRDENESKPAAAGKEQESPSEEETAKSSGNRSSGKKTKQLKPFIPSEEIAAEQAVDFPSDI